MHIYYSSTGIKPPSLVRSNIAVNIVVVVIVGVVISSIFGVVIIGIVVINNFEQAEMLEQKLLHEEEIKFTPSFQ